LTVCGKEIIGSDAVGTVVDAELLVAEAVLGTTGTVLAGAEVSRLWIDAEALIKLLGVGCTAAVKLTVCGKEIIGSDTAGTVADTELLAAEAVLGTVEAVLAVTEASDWSDVSRL
jgi:hypothetical protein